MNMIITKFYKLCITHSYVFDWNKIPCVKNMYYTMFIILTVFVVQNQLFSMPESRAYEYYVLFT